MAKGVFVQDGDFVGLVVTGGRGEVCVVFVHVVV
jgi:hypothetical protein